MWANARLLRSDGVAMRSSELYSAMITMLLCFPFDFIVIRIRNKVVIIIVVQTPNMLNSF